MNELSHKVRCIMPIFNFQVDALPIQLPYDLKICEISMDKVRALDGLHFPVLEVFELVHISHAIERTVPFSEGYQEVNETDKLFDSFILALRLFKAGHVDSKVIFYEYKPKRRAPRRKWFPKVMHAPLTKTKYVLKNKEIPCFIELMKKVHSKEWSDALSLPLFRFIKTYEDPRLEDKIIDCFIAFEALIMKGKSTNVQADVIPIATSLFLGKNDDEREEIRVTVKHLWTIRNKIVHGSKLSRDPKEIQELYWKCEDYLRQFIRKLIMTT